MKLVRTWSQTGSKLLTSLEPVCDHLRTSFEPASVMEFGFKGFGTGHGGRHCGPFRTTVAAQSEPRRPIPKPSHKLSDVFNVLGESVFAYNKIITLLYNYLGPVAPSSVNLNRRLTWCRQLASHCRRDETRQFCRVVSVNAT